MTTFPLASDVAPSLFRQVLAGLAAGVSVVTTVDEQGLPRGLTTTAVTSVSSDPPLLLVCVGYASRTLPALRTSGRFAVNVIHASAGEVAERFASKAEDKFAGIAWRPGRYGCPLLHGAALAWAECRVDREVDAGDHVVLIGLIEDGGAADGEHAPLTYYRRRFGTWTATESNNGGRPA